jgi:hypothetical protein
VQPCDRGDQIQPESQAWRVSCFLGPVETPQDGLAFDFAYTRAGILDSHNALAAAGNQADFDPPSPGGEFDGIIDEVGDSFDQQIPVTVSG